MCAFCEQEGWSGGSLPVLLRPRVARAQEIDQVAPVFLQQVPIDAQGTVEDTKDVDRTRALQHVGDSVVTVEKDADVPVGSLPVPVA